MITLIKTYIPWIRGLFIEWLYNQLDLEARIIDRHGEMLAHQRQHITYLSQRVHTLNKPIVEAQSKNFHYPTLDELIYEYSVFKERLVIKPSDEILYLEIVGHGICADYRYVGQANHRLYMKIVSSDEESVWYNCCEAVQAIGLIEKDGCYNVRHDKNVRSTPYLRACYIPGTKINGECTIYLRFGKIKDNNIVCKGIKVTRSPINKN